MLIYQEFIAINEELAAFDPSDKLRWAVHEIVVKLKSGEDLKFDVLCKRLKEYNINITPEIIKEIFTAWDKFNDADYSIFKKEDKNWLDVWPYGNYLKKKTRDKQMFGKHRKKETNYGTTNYGTGYHGYGYGRGGYYNNKVWKNGQWVDRDTGETIYGDYYGD